MLEEFPGGHAGRVLFPEVKHIFAVLTRTALGMPSGSLLHITTDFGAGGLICEKQTN